MDYSQLSDAELINCFLGHEPERSAIRDELFSRYYEQFDRRIRAVLYSRELPYSADESYYNDIFMAIYDAVFGLDGFERITSGYNVNKGEFGKWFLNYVVVNKVRDWLKKVDKETGLKNIDRLRQGIQREKDRLSLQQPVSASDPSGMTLAEVISVDADSPDIEKQSQISQAIDRLSQNQRVIIRLLFIAYEDLPDCDLDYLAAELDTSKTVFYNRIRELQNKLRASDKFNAGDKKELELTCLKEQHDHWTLRVARIKRELEGLYPDTLANDIANQIDGLKLKDIKTAKEKLTISHKANLINGIEYRKKLSQLNYHEALAHLAKIARRRLSAQQEYVSGKYLALPGYQELADMLQIAPGTVASRINRAAGNLKKQLEIINEGRNSS